MKTLTADFSPVALLDDTAVKWHDRRVKSSFAAMRRRWWLIVLLGCVGLGIAATWLYFAKPQYSATALIQLDMRNKVSSFDTVVNSPREGDPNVIRTEVEVLRSNAVAERVVKALGLTSDPEFSAPSKSLLAKLTDILPAELRTVLTSLGIEQGDDVSASDLPGSAADKSAVQVYRTENSGVSNQDGRTATPAQTKSRTTVLTEQNGVILGSISDISGGRTSFSGFLQDRVNDDKLVLAIRQVKKNLTIDADGRSYIITIGFAASSRGEGSSDSKFLC